MSGLNDMSEVDYYVDICMRFSPHKHQMTEFREHRDSPARALSWSMRTGKSKSIIDLAFYLFDRKKIKTVIILAPSGLQYTWVKREMPAHAWHADYKAHYWRSSEKNIHTEMCADLSTNKPLFLAFNNEALLLDRAFTLIKNALKRGPALLVVDESHSYSNCGAKRTKRLRGLAKHFAYRRILSGTMVSNSPLAAFPQFEILEPGALGFHTFGEFKGRYSNENPFMAAQGKRVPLKYQNLDELNVKIARWASVVGRADLSEMTYSVHDFELSEPQRKMYESLKKDFFLQAADGTKITAAEGVARLTKLQQVTSGYIIDESGTAIELVEPKSNPRLLALKEVLGGSTGKTIVWARFRKDIEYIKAMLGDAAVEFHGGIKAEDRQLAIDKFMKDPSCMYFVGTAKSGGSGINLSVAENVLFYSNSFDAVDRLQAVERATAVNGHAISVIDLSAIKTLDDHILGTLSNKKSISAEVITSKDI